MRPSSSGSAANRPHDLLEQVGRVGAVVVRKRDDVRRSTCDSAALRARDKPARGRTRRARSGLPERARAQRRSSGFWSTTTTRNDLYVCPRASRAARAELVGRGRRSRRRGRRSGELPGTGQATLGTAVARPRSSRVLAASRRGADIRAAVRERASARRCRDLELVVVDDGSTDATRDALDGDRRRAPPCRPQRRRRLGLAGALNVGLDEARGRRSSRGWTRTTSRFRTGSSALVARRMRSRRASVVGTGMIDLHADEPPRRRPLCRPGPAVTRWTSALLLPVLPLDRRRRSRRSRPARAALRHVVRRRARTTTCGRGVLASPTATTCVTSRSSCTACIPTQASRRAGAPARAAADASRCAQIAAAAPRSDGRGAELAWRAGGGPTPIELDAWRPRRTSSSSARSTRRDGRSSTSASRRRIAAGGRGRAGRRRTVRARSSVARSRSTRRCAPRRRATRAARGGPVAARRDARDTLRAARGATAPMRPCRRVFPEPTPVPDGRCSTGSPTGRSST